jgi:carboxyl-terminal processing protease
VSRHNDPGWHEKQPNKHNQPPFPAEPDDFDHYPFLPEAENPPEQQSHASRNASSQDPTRRFARILRQALLTLVLVVLAFLGGWFAHQYFNQTTFDTNNQSRAYAQLIQQAWTDIDQRYVDHKAINYQKMSYAAINAMVNTLGDTAHSRFMDPQTVQGENQQLNGRSVGIGLYLHQDATTQKWVISAPRPNTPADKAGLRPGDVIITFDGVDITGEDATTVNGLIHQPVGTTVTLVIQRSGESQTRTFTMTMAVIETPNVIMHYIPESHTVEIQVVQFTSGIAAEVRDDINKAKGMGATKIILDLRNNPGGDLNEAVKMSSLFLQSGNVLLERDSTGQRVPISVYGNPIDTTSPITILVNRNTDSSAEIVTAALKENHRATVIGETTFGTGTILEQISLADGSALSLGTLEWLTPDGHFVRQVAGDPNSGGIKPDMEVHQDPKLILTPNQENQSNMSLQQILNSGDAQLAAAIQYLNQQK